MGSADTAAARAVAMVEAAQEFAPELTPEACEMLTATGLVNATAEVYRAARMGGDRDENASWRCQLKCIELLSGLLERVLVIDSFESVGKRLDQVEAMLNRKAQGAATSFAEGFDPPAEPGTGAN